MERKKITCVEESLKYIGQFENDPIIKKRFLIIDRVKNILKKGNNVVLIKGQDVDLEANLPNLLRKEFPNDRHQIIFLHTNMQLLYERSQKKSWWSQEDEEEGIEGFKKWLIDGQLKNLPKLQGFDIVALDSINYEYKPIKFPPEIK